MSVHDPDAMDAEIRAALPPGWYAHGLRVDVDLYPRTGYPRETYGVTFSHGRGIEGGPTRYYGRGESSTEPSGRRMEVEASGQSIADLVEVAKMLPSLDPMASLRWPIEVRISGDTIP